MDVDFKKLKEEITKATSSTKFSKPLQISGVFKDALKQKANQIKYCLDEFNSSKHMSRIFLERMHRNYF